MIESKHNEEIMLWPKPRWFSNSASISTISGYHLMEDITWPPGGFFHLHSQWHSSDHQLPKGYKYYVLSWHGEYMDHEWIKAQNITEPVIVLHDWNHYIPSSLPDNFITIRWIHWHYPLEKMVEWFGTKYTKNIRYKASAFCNRITQSKVWITTALLNYLDETQRLISLSDWLEEKNVHHWEPTGNTMLDDLQNNFRTNWIGKKISIDNFINDQNFQRYTANPAHPAYQECALHFTNESWHYSLMQEQNKKYIFPGPNFSEKTLKCLLGGTAFIPVGQFDVYRTLNQLGMQFDYEFDVSFDQDPGNISRAEKIVNLIRSLDQYTANDLFEMTRKSSQHNQEHIVSRDFFNLCESKNKSVLPHLQTTLDNV
jgi:hypothetical protein